MPGGATRLASSLFRGIFSLTSASIAGILVMNAINADGGTGLLHSIIMCLAGEQCMREAVRAALKLTAAGYDSRVLPCSDQAGGVLALTGELSGTAQPEQTLLLADDPEVAAALLSDGWYVSGLQPVGSDAPFPGVGIIFCEIDEVEPDSFVKAWQRQAGLPWHIMTTRRCLIRETTMEDLDSFYEIYSEPSMTRYMEGLYADPEDERRYLKDYIDTNYKINDPSFGVLKDEYPYRNIFEFASGL